jgi:fructose/tagatose bisphosphate aldolase
MATIAAIHAKLPNTHLVMHGSSSVPQYLQDLINAHGGEMPQTYGVPVEEIERGIAMGVRKVNIDTDCRMAMTGQFRKIARDKPPNSIRASSTSPRWQSWRRCAATGSNASGPPARPARSSRSRWTRWPRAMPPARLTRRSPIATSPTAGR